MKKAIMISYRFPPFAGSGVFKTLKFVKYLRNFGWEPIVISSKSSKFAPMDKTLLKEVPDKIKVFRTYSIESKVYRYLPEIVGINSKWYQTPDAFIGWLPSALFKAQEVVKKEKPNVIYSTSPPVTSHLIAMLLKKKTGLPWVADFRDPWTDNMITNYPTNFHRRIEEKIEHKIGKNADRIVFTMDHHREHFLKKYPDISPNKCVYINNGYDHEDFKDIKVDKSKVFTLTYIGSFYDNITPLFLLQAIKSIIEKNKIDSKDFQVLFVGRKSKTCQNLIHSFGLNDVVKEIGYVSHKEAIRYMHSSSCLFFIIGLGKRSEWVYSSKIFEYIASGTPIITTVPKRSVVRDLIKETNSGVIIDTDDVNGIENALQDYYKKWKEDDLQVQPKWDVIKNYERKNLTKKLSEVFNDLS